MERFLADKTALVTGGGRGIGKAIAMRLASAGARVAVAARSAGQIGAVAAAIRERGGEAMKVMAGRGGRIINIGSVVGYKGYAEQGIYAASKHGLMGLTKVMAVEGQKDGVIAQIICPGGVATDMLAEARPDLVGGDVMSPEDVADAVEYLLRQRGNAVTDMIALRRRNGTPW